jgi:hypothetical protein
MTHDVLGTIDAIRPATTPLDEEWSDATLTSILAAPADRRAPRKRVPLIVAGAVGIGLLGAGAAAAAGLAPQAFTDMFSGWGTVWPESEPGTQAVDPATAGRVATAAGPGDTVFSVLAAPGRDGFACVAVLFETAASAAAPEPTDFVDADGSYCAYAPSTDARFGDMAALDGVYQPAALGAPDVRVFSISAGSATRAVVRTADGERPLLRFEGRFYGWFAGHGDRTRPAVVVGYADDGTEVARTRV